VLKRNESMLVSEEMMEELKDIDLYLANLKFTPEIIERLNAKSLENLYRGYYMDAIGQLNSLRERFLDNMKSHAIDALYEKEYEASMEYDYDIFRECYLEYHLTPFFDPTGYVDVIIDHVTFKTLAGTITDLGNAFEVLTNGEKSYIHLQEIFKDYDVEIIDAGDNKELSDVILKKYIKIVDNYFNSLDIFEDTLDMLLRLDFIDEHKNIVKYLDDRRFE
jgi:hypothetical protein